MKNEKTIADVTQRLVTHVRERSKDLGSEPQTLPVSEYTDPARYGTEMRALFRELPIVLAHSSQLANPGDFLTDDRLGVPLLLVRTATGTVAAHVNVCSHRSSIVETASSGNRAQFLCPYHGWTYGLDGTLLKITDAESFAGLEPPPAGLRSVAAVEKYGLIFVRIAPGPPIDIDAFLGPMAPELESLELTSYKYFATKRTPLRCNWKVQQEGSLETYHFGAVHSQSIAKQFNGMAHVFDRFGDHQRFVVPRRKLLERHDQGENTRDQILPTYFIFPNTAFTVPHDHAMFVQVFPRDVRQCVFENALLISNSAEQKDPGHWQRALDLTQGVNAEDFGIVEGIQTAYDNAPAKHVIHGRYEQGLTEFHRAIDRTLLASARRANDSNKV